MGRLNTSVLVTIMLAVIGAIVVGGMELSALESRQQRAEQDIRELRTEIRDSLRELKAEVSAQRDLILATKTAIDVHAAQERRGAR